MPRVTMAHTTNNVRDFNIWVAGQIKVRKLRQEDVATYLNINQGGLSRRISGDTEWKLKEVFDLFNLFGETYQFKRSGI